MTEILDSTKAFPHCPGCGHPHVLRAFDSALQELKLPHQRISVVTDIGCVGLADALFPTVHTVHTLHGRSVAVAAGVKMGALESKLGPLKTIVLIGDGGVGIGLLHVVHAAQMNVDVTVLVHNNLLYGMTGGQHSGLTPPGMKTVTTPEGCAIPPLDLGAVLIGAGAGFFGRTIAPGEQLTSIIEAAVEHPGFSCVEIFELCPAFATKRAGITGKSLQAIPEAQGLELGIVHQETTRPPFKGLPPQEVEEVSSPSGESPPGIIPNSAWSHLDRTVRIVVAGRAGERVQSAAMFAASAGCAAGLHTTIRADNPVTQGSGFSLAEITFSPDSIAYTGLVEPDLLIMVAEEGVQQIQARGLFASEAGVKRMVMDESLPPPSDLSVHQGNYRKRFGPKLAALGAVMEEIQLAGWWDGEAWNGALEQLPPSRRKDIEGVMSKMAATP